MRAGALPPILAALLVAPALAGCLQAQGPEPGQDAGASNESDADDDPLLEIPDYERRATRGPATNASDTGDDGTAPPTGDGNATAPPTGNETTPDPSDGNATDPSGTNAPTPGNGTPPTPVARAPIDCRPGDAPSWLLCDVLHEEANGSGLQRFAFDVPADVHWICFEYRVTDEAGSLVLGVEVFGGEPVVLHEGGSVGLRDRMIEAEGHAGVWNVTLDMTEWTGRLDLVVEIPH